MASPTLDPETLMDEGADTVHETARFFGCSDRHVYRLIADDVLPSVRSGRRVLVPRKARREYLARLLKAEQRAGA